VLLYGLIIKDLGILEMVDFSVKNVFVVLHQRRRGVKMISKGQAKILSHLLDGGEIRLRRGGMFDSHSEKVDGRSLIGLNKRGLLKISASHYMPSIGHLGSPVFYDDGITEEGLKELKKYLDSVSYLERINTDWMKRAFRLLATKVKKDE